MRYREEERLALQASFAADAEWLEEEDYPVFVNGVYDWLPPSEEELYDESA